jgi:hypothetical protein
LASGLAFCQLGFLSTASAQFVSAQPSLQRPPTAQAQPANATAQPTDGRLNPPPPPYLGTRVEIPGTAFPDEMTAIESTFRHTQPADAEVDWVYFIVYRPTLSFNLASPMHLYQSLHWQNLGHIHDMKSGDVTIGHFETAWSCETYPRRASSVPSVRSPSVRGATGHTGDRTESAFKLVQSGGGMTPVLADYMDGYLEPAGMVNQRFKQGADDVQLIAAAVSPEDCRRVDAFFKEFQRRGADVRFGVMADPSKFEGGVCWSTAQAATAHIPILNSLFQSYLLSFNVPWRLMGPLPQKPNSYERYPEALSGQHFAPVRLDAFNFVYDWNVPGERSYPYRTFDFQAFGNEFEQWFRGCDREWCQEGRKAGARVVRVHETSGLPIDALMLDARH